jgi:hypothetical protein
VKGPSTTVRDLPENLTRAPLEVGTRLRPSSIGAWSTAFIRPSFSHLTTGYVLRPTGRTQP